MSQEKISVLIPEEKIEDRIVQLAEQISKDYQGETVKLVCILKGSIIFTCELAKGLQFLCFLISFRCQVMEAVPNPAEAL